MNFEQALEGQRVLVTGHTGFTGGWLSLWLHAIGCKVHGLALAPQTDPNLFSAAGLGGKLDSRIGDIRDFSAVEATVTTCRPSVIFHLAAQPLVSRGYADPLETFATNVQGTAHVLEAARTVSEVKAVVCVTTDKVYRDRDWQWGYRETDELGGKDPYAASKAAAELVAACYRTTMAARGNGVLVATARGGNIIGGGDWSQDRIVPDFVRAVSASQPLVLRNPAAVRPWQHVLALVHGYLTLASGLLRGETAIADTWNFGPRDDGAVSVDLLVDGLARAWKRPEITHTKGDFVETRFLHLDSAKARSALGWQPPIGLHDTIRLTAEWYRGFYEQSATAEALTAAQIESYRAQLRGAS